MVETGVEVMVVRDPSKEALVCCPQGKHQQETRSEAETELDLKQHTGGAAVP